jgi:hypothetical protein
MVPVPESYARRSRAKRRGGCGDLSQCRRDRSACCPEPNVSLSVIAPWRGKRIFDAKLKPAHGSRKGRTIQASRPVTQSSLTNGRLWRRAPQRGWAVPSDRKPILAGSRRRAEGTLAWGASVGTAKAAGRKSQTNRSCSHSLRSDAYQTARRWLRESRGFVLLPLSPPALKAPQRPSVKSYWSASGLLVGVC